MKKRLQQWLVVVMVPVFCSGALSACQRAGEDSGGATSGASDGGTSQSGRGDSSAGGGLGDSGAAGGGYTSPEPSKSPQRDQ